MIKSIRSHLQDPTNKYIIIIITILILTTGVATQSRAAQPSQFNWSYPVEIHQQTLDLHQPLLVGDRSGLLHLFWSNLPRSGEDALNYMRYDGETWTAPVDLFTGSNITSQSAVVDEEGFIHLVWNDGLQLYYSQAPVSEAFSAGSWSSPLYLGDSLLHSQVVAGPDNQIFIIYPALGAGGPTLIRSEDGGASWYDSQNIAFTAAEDTAADFTRLAIAPDGSMHAVWTEYQQPNGIPPTGIYYAGSIDNGQSWSRPVQLAGGGFVQANIITDKSNNVHVVWNGVAGVGGRYHRRSTDGGKSWSPTTVILPPPAGGTEGVPELVTDSANNIHLISGYNQCPTYSSFQNQQWTNTACLAQGVISSGYSEEPTMTITEGNRLHVVFWGDRKRLFYTSIQTSAPSLASQPFPTPTLFATPTSIHKGSTAATPSPLPPALAESLQADTRAPTLNPIWPVAAAVLLALLVIAGALAIRYFSSRRR